MKNRTSPSRTRGGSSRPETLTKESLTLEYTWEGGDYAGIDVYTITATYRRR